MPILLAGTGQALDSVLPTIYDKFLTLRDDTGVARSCATMYNLKPHTGSTKNIVNYGRTIAYGLDDGVDMAQAQNILDDLTSYTPAEVGVQVVTSGRTLSRTADSSFLSTIAKICNNAYDLKEDSDGLSALASFTSTIGSAGTVFSPGHAAAVGGRLTVGNSRANPEPVPGPWYGILHPYTALVLVGRLVPYGSTPGGAAAYGANTGAHAGVTVGPAAMEGMGPDLIKHGLGALGQVGQVTMKVDANYSVDSSDDAVQGFFGKEGFVYVSEEEPRIDNDTSDKSMRGAVETNCWGSYVFGLYRAANYGIAGTFDASTPTS